MADLNPHAPDRRPSPGTWRRLYLRYRDSDTTLGVAVAVIAALFIAGIVAAFIHAADLNKEQHAQNTATPPAAETTGSGSTGR